MNTSNLTIMEIIYMGSALIGGTFFGLRTIMMFIGGDFFNTEVEGEFHGDLDVDGDFETSHDSDFSFKFLSMQGLTAFFTMFGLVGLTLFRAGIHPLLTVVGGVGAGLFVVWVISLLFALTGRLQSEGTIRIKNAVGATGTVYLSIPAKGSGQVQVAVQGSLKVIDAVSGLQKKIATGDKVRVVDTLDEKTLVVEKIN